MAQRLLRPTDYSDPQFKFVVTQNQEVHAKFERFVSQLEEFLGVKRTVVDLRKMWNEQHYHLSGSFDDYFKYTYEAIVNRDSYTNNIGFVKDYEKNFGRRPYLPPSITNRWKHGRTITGDERRYAVDQVGHFKLWFQKDVLGYNNTHMSTAVMVMPWTVGIPTYRDSPKPEPNANYGYGFQPAYVSSFTGGPEFVFPIGTWTYNSKVSKREERLPVAAGLIAAERLDHELLGLATEFLEKSDLPKAVFTGRETLGPEVKRSTKELHPPSYSLH